MIVVVVSVEGSEPRTWPFTADRVRIGREGDNDLVIPHKACSRYHAEIIRHTGGYRIVDLGSTNGLKVGDKKVSELEISHGAVVKISDITLTFTLPQEEASADRTVAVSLEKVPKVDKTQKIDTQPAPAELAPAEPVVLYLVYRLRGRDQSLKVVAGIDYLIGRAPGADLLLTDKNVSGRHAMLSSRDEHFYLKDLDSANGTLLNDRKIDEAEVHPGDRLTIGRTTLTVSKERPTPGGDRENLLARTQMRIPQQADGAEVVGRSGSRAGVFALGVFAVVAVVVIAALLLRSDSAPGTGDGGNVTSLTPVADTGGGEVIVKVAAIEEKELVLSVSGAGSIRPQQTVTVSAEVAARVLDITVSEGDAVSRGQLLARLDAHQLELQIEEARSSVNKEQVDLAREDYQRKERLFNEGAVTRSVSDQAKSAYLQLDSAYRATQARIRQLRELLAKTRITAPAAGTVARKMVSPGELVAPGAPVVMIENVEEVVAEVEISDRDIVKVRPLQVVEATSDAFPGRIFNGVVEKVGATANPVTRAFKVEARIGNQDGVLRSGMIASIRIILEKRSGLVVPAEALLDDRQDRSEVFFVDGGVARKVRIALGQRMEREVELREGLSAGDQVIVFGHDNVIDGEPVKIYQ